MPTSTNIAALMRDMRDLADRIVDAEGDNNNGEVGRIIDMYDAAYTTFNAQNILLVLNAFEAERQRCAEITEQYVDRTTALSFATQRAEAAESRVGVLEGIIARKEFEALKGDQVPVTMDALRDAVAEMSGGLPHEWLEGLDKGHHAVPFINFNSLHRIVTKFTAPQKPLGIRQIGYIDHDGGEHGEYFAELTDSAEIGQAVYVIDAAIEAAGGIVQISDAGKDGE